MRHQDGAAQRDTINVLDCAFCNRWFPTFDRLAKHTYARHGSPNARPSQDDESMAKSERKQTARKSTPRGRGSIPAPSGDAPGTFSPFLKAHNIGKPGTKVKVTILDTAEPRLVDGEYGEQIVVPVKVGREHYDWGITVDSVNHRILFDRFGRDPKAWKGSVSVEVRKSKQNRPFIAIV